MRFSRISTVLAATVTFTTSVSAQGNPFSQYPTCAQSCFLSAYAGSTCYGSTNVNCVCENLTFLQKSTSCTDSACSAADATSAWSIADALCLQGKANMSIFYAGTGRNANGERTTNATATASGSASSANSSPTFTNTELPASATTHTKLSNGALAGIVVGVVVGLTLLAATIFWFVHNWWTIEEVGPPKNYGGEMGYRYGPKPRPATQRPDKTQSMWYSPDGSTS